MAKLLWAIFLFATWALSVSADVDASSSSSSPPLLLSIDCSDAAMAMISCLDYITEGSNVTAPSAKCCDALRSVVQNSLECLCEGFKMAPDLGVSLNITRALSLPDSCIVLVPDLRSCIVSPPGSAPAPPKTSPSPPKPSPAPPVSPPPPSVPSPAPPVSPPTPSEPSPAPAVSPPASTPEVNPPVEPPFDSSEAPSPSPSGSGSWELSSSVMVLLVCVAVASVTYLL